MTPTKYYDYCIMPYCLINAPFVFQGFMNEVLQECLHHFVLVNIDTLVCSWNSAENWQHIALVLEKLCEFNMSLKAEKYTFHQASTHFLKYLINVEGIKMDSGRWKQCDPGPFQPLLKYIKNYSSITASLSRTTSPPQSS